MGARCGRPLGRNAGVGVTKGLETVEADAQRLPFEDETFDAATMISMLHHVEDRGVALAEARRILRPQGRLVLNGYTGEDAATLWILDYFPSSRRWIEATHPPRAAILEELPGARLFAFEFEDMQDASLAAISADPNRVLEAAERGETSYFERMWRDHPEELRAGIARLREDIGPIGPRSVPGRRRCAAGPSARDTRASAASKRPRKYKSLFAGIPTGATGVEPAFVASGSRSDCGPPTRWARMPHG